MKKKAIIIGAGPAGLTAAWELLKYTDITPVILEKSGDIGGISKTVNYKGNRIDIGGHRFFSKSDRVMKWWVNMMPLTADTPQDFAITYHNTSVTVDRKGLEADAFRNNEAGNVMLLRKRLSRIYFLRRFFNYPIQLSFDTLRKLGVARTISIIFSYLYAQVFPVKQEKSLQDFMINRFGVKLYRLFFKDYTEKVWGVPCEQISAEWGAQRIKGVSISKALKHALTRLLVKHQPGDITQKGTETSLIEQFLYPAYGPGQLWEEVARQVQAMGGELHLYQDVDALYAGNKQVTAVAAHSSITQEKSYYEGDYFFSTMPVKELIAGLQAAVPQAVRDVAAGLQYRDFITVGVLLRQLEPAEGSAKHIRNQLPDTWIYIQEKDVRVGRIQIFNNWSPYMVKDPDTVWIGMEYFCNTGDGFWEKSEAELKEIAVSELVQMGLARVNAVLDTTVIRVEKTYPAYFGSYERFEEIRSYTDTLENLFLVGRNGMHKYNNSDHSMLTAMVAVDNIRQGIVTKENIWAINTEQEYHEEKAGAAAIEKESTVPQQQQEPVAAAVGFSDFVFSNTTHKKILLWSAGIALVLWGVFKYFYPWPGFYNGDSYSYLAAAFNNQDINTYPIGYSKFLRLLSVFSTSGNLLVTLQFAMLQASGLFLLFSLFYFLPQSRAVKWILALLLCANPVYLYLANYVLSDSLFISLSMVWFALLLWIVYRPGYKVLLWHTLVIFTAFTVRYNALYYPVIAAFAFLLSGKRNWLYRVTGIVLSVLLIGVYIGHHQSRYKQLTGTAQFAPFSGWQLLNNAMYVYRYVPQEERKTPPPALRQLDAYVRNYFDTSKDIRTHPIEMIKASTVYMWDARSPLQQYMHRRYVKDSTTDKEVAWAKAAPLYAEYGRFLISTYPGYFARHYLWYNLMKYYTPPVEFLEVYNSGKDSIHVLGQQWFHYPAVLKTRAGDYKVKVLNYHPLLFGASGVLFLSGVLGFFLLGGGADVVLRKAVLLAVFFFVVNLGFSVFASPIAMRFQLFPLMIYLPFAVLLTGVIVQIARKGAAGAFSGNRVAAFPLAYESNR